MVHINVKAPEEIYDLASAAARKEEIPLGEYALRAIAERLGRPELVKAMHRTIGRPRRDTKDEA